MITPITNPTNHLTCFEIDEARGQPEFDPRDVVVANQFDDEVLKVSSRQTLCVPSSKVEIDVCDRDSSDQANCVIFRSR